MTESFEQSKVTWESLLMQAEVFSGKLRMLEACKKLSIDHACVRLKNSTDVQSVKESIAAGSEEIISAVNVNGREIVMVQLTEPLPLGHWQTAGVELPFPKPNHNYEDGWEHVEFVLEGAENTLDGVREAFFKTFPQVSREQLEADYQYSEDEPQADDDQMPNPTIGIKVNGVGLKFHANPIQQVVGHQSY